MELSLFFPPIPFFSSVTQLSHYLICGPSEMVQSGPLLYPGRVDN